jgi:hypothetical protein
MGKVTPEYNLTVIHPKVAKEWHPTKNKPLILLKPSVLDFLILSGL